MSTHQINLAGHQVSPLGFGLMMLTWNPEVATDEVAFSAMKAAADAGSVAWSTAMFYGNEDPTANIKLIRRFFDEYPEYAEKIVLVVKGGIDMAAHGPFKGDELSKQRNEILECQKLLGTKKIDVFLPARIAPHRPVETLFTDMKTLKEEGLFGEVGASEIGLESLKKVEKIVPIAVVEIEVSLWAYTPDIRAVVEHCRDSKIPVFAYAPMGRGFLSRKFKSFEDIPDGSIQKRDPRFQPENFNENLKFVDALDELAKKKGLATTQLALAWVCHLSPYNIPIPGSRDPARVKSNSEAAGVKLTAEDLKDIDEMLAKTVAKGDRYMPALQRLAMQ